MRRPSNTNKEDRWTCINIRENQANTNLPM